MTNDGTCRTCGNTTLCSLRPVVACNCYKPLPAPAPEPEKKEELCHTCAYNDTCLIRDRDSERSGCDQYRPIRPTAPEPTWRPEAGKPALFLTMKMDVIAVHDGFAWCRDDDGAFSTQDVTNLKPLPPAPPVKEGEYLSVTRQGKEYVGMGVNVDKAACMFQVTGYSVMFDWTDEGTKIIHLVPAQSAPGEALGEGE